IAYLQQLMERGEAQQNRGSTATAAHHLGWVYLNQGNTAMARRFSGKALALYKDIEDARGLSDAYEQLGRIALAEGKAKDALFHLQQSLVMRNQLGNQHGAASSSRHLAMAYLEMGHLILATRAMWQSLHTYSQLGMLTRQRVIAIFRQLFYWMIRKPRWTE